MTSPIDINLARRAVMARERRLHQASSNFTAFVETVSRDETGKPFTLAPHHLAWHRHIEYCWARKLNAGIVAPWGHGKSSGLIAPLIAFLLGRNPNSRIKCICNDDASAKKRVGLASKVILSPTYKRIFPHIYKGGTWTKHMIYVNRPGDSPEPSVEARGIFTTGIGGRADVCLYDDIVDQKNSGSPEQRNKVRETMTDTWSSRLEATGLSLAIATLWHVDDATYSLMRSEGWCFLVQRISVDLMHIEQELIGGPWPDYPGLIAA